MGPYYWTINASNPIIMDQDGQGVGSPATISNSSQNTTGNNALYFIGDAGITLNDDLQVLNPAGAFSQNDNGSVQFATPITGSGNITFNSDGPISSTASSSPGAIWVERTNSFTVPVGGKILVQKGLVTVNNGDGTDVTLFTPFGDKANPITIGQMGSGSAGLLSRLSNAPIDYAVTIAPAAVGETRTFGAASNGTFTVSSQTVTLNGDLNLRAGTTSLTATQSYTGNFSGVGSLNKVGSAVARLAGVNTYGGTTTVSEGTLLFENETSLYNADNSKWNATNLVVQSGAALGFSIGSAGNFTDADIAMLNGLGSATGGFKSGSFLALNPTVASYTYSNVITDSNTGGGLPAGDYNGNGVVDAADFVLWRKDPGAFPPDAYDTWRTHFGADWQRSQLGRLYEARRQLVDADSRQHVHRPHCEFRWNFAICQHGLVVQFQYRQVD